MTQPFFTSNEADVDQLTGVYVIETVGPSQITGINLNGALFIGTAARGPANKVVDISGGDTRMREVFGWRDYTAGGSVSGPTIKSELYRAGLNLKFGKVAGVRVVAASAAGGTLTFYTSGIAVLRLDLPPGAWSAGGAVTGAIQNASDGDATHCDIVINDLGREWRLRNYSGAGSNDNSAQVLSAAWPDVDTQVVSAVTKLAAGRPDNVAAANFVGGGDGAITTPAAPTGVITSGAAGSYAYRWVARSALTGGVTTDASAAYSTSAGPTTLDNTHYIDVTEPTPVAGAAAYDLYRTTGGTSQGKIATISAGLSALTVRDNGLVGDAGTAPVSNGTANLAATDFTASGKALEVAAAYKGVGIMAAVGIPSATQPAVNAKVLTLAATNSDRLFLIGAADENVAKSTAISDVPSYRSDRVVYCYGHYWTWDNEVATKVVQSPIALMASILNQTDVDIDPGDEDNKALSTGAVELHATVASFGRQDFIDLKNAGIAALENDDGIGFVEAVTTSLVAGREYITRRRSADALLIAIGKALKPYVKKKSTPKRRRAMKAVIDSYLDDLKEGERIVEDYLISVPAPSANTRNRQEVLGQIPLLPHMREVVFRAAIGETVSIREVN